jgi:LmbE family N-acetylglucosaminyl deacetylase
MLHSEIARRRGQPLRILCLGAHSDDIEIGCGGSILKLVGGGGTPPRRSGRPGGTPPRSGRPGRPVEVYWVVFSSGRVRAAEAKKSAERFLARAPKRTIVVKRFRDGYFPQQSTAIKDYFETLKTFKPDIVFTHYRDDRHQDHRIVSDLTWNTFRDALVLEYEIPKYDGDIGTPNVFMHLDPSIVDEKIQLLLEMFETQAVKDWFDGETFRAMLRLRGVESRSRYAEAFYGRKVVLE